MSKEVDQKLIPRSFRSWKQTEIQDVFGLVRVEELAVLNQWIADKEDVPGELIPILKHLQSDLKLRAEAWTEEEWKLSFIGPVIALVDYNTKTTGFFSGRLLEAELSGYLLTGMPDGMVAKGVLGPKAPYFCLHEYKKEESDQSDPRGQLLAAMLASQVKNKDEEAVIYGAYVLGRNWFFSALKGKEYAFSEDFSATKDELFEIVGILLALKTRILKLAGA